MKFTHLTKNQKTCQKALAKEIQNAKTQAFDESHGIQHKYVIIATKKLVDLYSQPRFSDNYNFLLRRYCKLENGNTIWLLIFIPIFLTLLYDCVKNYFIPLIYDVPIEIYELALLFKEAQINGTPIIVTLLIILFAVLLLLTYEGFILIRELLLSVSRNAESTLRENELAIIKQRLIDVHILNN